MILTSFPTVAIWSVAVSLVSGAPATESTGASAVPTPPPVTDTAQAPGTLELSGGARGGGLAVHDATGEVVARVSLQPGQTTNLQLTPGLYEVRPDSPGVNGAPARVASGQTARFSLPGRPPAPVAERAREGPGNPEDRDVAAAGKAVAAADARARPEWKRPVAPIMSALIPGTGQFINGEIGKGFGMLLGSGALATGAAVLYRTADPLEGAAAGGNSESFGASVVTAAGFGVMTGGLAMLYAAQIMDAYAVAAGVDSPTPRRRHRIALEVGRSATVGYRVGDPAAALYPDWSVSLLIQVIPRLSVGISDMSLKFGSDVGRVTMQAGARVQYRFYDRGRLWISAGLGSIIQGSVANGHPKSLVLNADPPPGESSFAAVPYGQLDFRYFIVDRWSLNLVPRVSVPFGTRFYGGDRAIPSHAVTFELGTGVGVYF